MSGAFTLSVNRWPYGLEVQVVEGGLLLKPQRKARAGWERRFKARVAMDELLEVRAIQNEFDKKGWEW